jgi:hypothetical protein
MIEVRFFSLALGQKFWFEKREYIKIESMPRDDSWGLNLKSFRVSKFLGNESGIFISKENFRDGNSPQTR